MNIAIIPARGGSKRIPRKNIKTFCGKPMLAWPIEAAKASGIFDRIIVSTDDAEIATTAVEFGADVPFERPASLADDHAPVTDAVRHAAEWLAESGTPANQLTLIYPTSPMLRPDDLQQAQARFDEAPNAPYLMSITTFPYPIDRALLDDKNGLRMRWPEHRMTRSQNLPDCFHDAALFIFGHCEAWRNGIDVFGQGTLGYRVPRHCVQDIDTLEDWGHAEAMMKAQGLDASD